MSFFIGTLLVDQNRIMKCRQSNLLIKTQRTTIIMIASKVSQNYVLERKIH